MQCFLKYKIFNEIEKRFTWTEVQKKPITLDVCFKDLRKTLLRACLHFVYLHQAHFSVCRKRSIGKQQ